MFSTNDGLDGINDAKTLASALPAATGSWTRDAQKKFSETDLLI